MLVLQFLQFAKKKKKNYFGKVKIVALQRMLWKKKETLYCTILCNVSNYDLDILAYLFYWQSTDFNFRFIKP